MRKHDDTHFKMVKGVTVLALCCGMSLQVSAIPDYSWDLRDDYSYAENKLPEASITAGMVAQLNQVDSYYNVSETYPSGAGLSAARMQEIDDIVNITYAIQRDPQSQEVTGRAIVIDGETAASVPNPAQPASFNGDWVPDVNTIIGYYASASAAQQPIVEQAYQDMIELYLNVGAFPGGGAAIPFIGNGYTWRNTTWKTLRMCHTLPDDVRNLFALSVFFVSKGGVLLDEIDPYCSTDVYHCFYLTAFRALSRLDDNAFKWQLMNTIRLQLDKTILGYPEHPQSGLVTIDGGIIHHTGHHIHYAGYSFEEMVWFPTRMSAAGFNSELTPAAIERCRKAARAWAWNSTNGEFPVHYNLRPAFPSASISGGLAVGKCVDFLKACAQYTVAYQGGSIATDLEMAYPAIAKTGQGSTLLPVEWRSLVPPDDSALTGHEAFNVMGAASHRGDDWMASVRGAHNYRRGGEGYDSMGRPDHHHVKSMRGSLLLITEGDNGRDPNGADSGYAYEGWDHNFYPNVTSRIEPLIDLLYWRVSAYFSGLAKLTGGASLDGNGVWFYVPDDGSQRKSAFFFDNRITLVTSDVTYSSASADVVTGLIQQRHTDFANQPLILNGTSRSGTGTWTLPAGGGHTVYDGNGNGYFIHAGAPAVTAMRGQQSWTYGLPEYYIGAGSMPSYVYATDFVADVDAGKFAPSVGDYSRVYFNHGTAPSGVTFACSVLVKPQPGDLETLATRMATPGSEPFTLETTSGRHVFYDKATQTRSAVLFTNSQTLNLGHLVSIGRKGAYIWREYGDRIELGCSTSYMDDLSPFTITLAGQWELHDEVDTLNPSAVFDGVNTTLTLPYRQFAEQKVVLYMGYETWRKNNFPDGGEDGENDDPDEDNTTNREEFDAGTDPNDGNDYFHARIAITNNLKTISFNTSSNRTYSLEMSTNLIEGAWSVFGEEMKGTGGDLSATDSDVYPNVFYRAWTTRP